MHQAVRFLIHGSGAAGDLKIQMRGVSDTGGQI